MPENNLDHHELVNRIINDIEVVFSSDEFKEKSARYKDAVEQSREEFCAPLRREPMLVQAVKECLARRAEGQLFSKVITVGDVAQLEGIPPVQDESLRNEIMRVMAGRGAIYREIMGADVAVCWWTDGTEGVVDQEYLQEDIGAFYETTWHRPQSEDRFPFDRVEYLVGSSMLRKMWESENRGSFTIQTKAGDYRVLHGLAPVAALMAVERWPVVFFEPKYLRRQLGLISGIRIG